MKLGHLTLSPNTERRARMSGDAVQASTRPLREAVHFFTLVCLVQQGDPHPQPLADASADV